MAGSRSHKFGSIFFRASGLIDGGVMDASQRPLWFDVYKHYPPHFEPSYDRPILDIPVKPIFFEEDMIRVKIHSMIKLNPYDLENDKRENRTVKLMAKCQSLMKEKGLSVDEALKALIDKT